MKIDNKVTFTLSVKEAKLLHTVLVVFDNTASNNEEDEEQYSEELDLARILYNKLPSY